MITCVSLAQYYENKHYKKIYTNTYQYKKNISMKQIYVT